VPWHTNGKILLQMAPEIIQFRYLLETAAEGVQYPQKAGGNFFRDIGNPIKKPSISATLQMHANTSRKFANGH
jgi:hypothetical protein